jgi:hypothetical protein
MVFSAQFVPVAVHAMVNYITLLLSNNRTALREWCVLWDPCRNVISKTFSEELSEELVGELVIE